MKSIKIKDTTREERIRIVLSALGEEYDVGCEGFGLGAIDDMYQPYIDGIKEIAEINAEYRRNYTKGDPRPVRDSGCGFNN